jgi:hypothetical protein
VSNVDDSQRAAIQSRVIGDLKQSCLDLAAAAGDLFDLFDQHGLEAAWEGPLVVARMEKAHNHITDFLRHQATRRMLALGVSPEALARMVTDQNE